MRASSSEPSTSHVVAERRSDLPEAATLAREGAVLAGKYRVERVIGSGGMGLVVAALHLSLNERVAVKLLLPRMLSRPDAAARFLREGRAAARIRSEHVARVLDAGKLESGEPFLVLEYLRGRDLRSEVLASGPLSVEDAVGYVLHACEGLAEAHAYGVIHRDLKPANLFLTRRADGSPLVKIIDFGVSKLRCPETGDLTESDVAIGTPHYMAPEQMRAARDVDPRADIFSLGAVLFWLLTGTLPFPGESMVSVYDRQREGPPSLSGRAASVPPGLSAVVERCLRLSPDDRYPDVGVLAAALAPFAPPWARPSAERARRITEERPPMSLQLPDDGTPVDGFGSTVLASPANASETEPSRDPTWGTGSGERRRREERSDSGGGERRPEIDGDETASPDGAVTGDEEASPLALRSPPAGAARPPSKALVVAAIIVAAVVATLVFATTRSPDSGDPQGATAAIQASETRGSAAATEPTVTAAAEPTVTAAAPIAESTTSSIPTISPPPTAGATGKSAPSARATAARSPSSAPASTPTGAGAKAPGTTAPRPWTPGPMDTPD